MELFLETLNHLYGLTLNSPEKVEKGFLSENHILSHNGTKYFLKKYRFNNKERIEEIHLAKKYFADGGIPVILPLKNRNGETFFQYENSFYALFPFVYGLQPERGSLTKEMIISLGRMLGRIHLLGKKSELEIDDLFKGWDKDKALETAQSIEDKLNKIENRSEFDELTQEVINFKKDQINKNDINFADLNLHNDHLVHGDYLDQNVFFDDVGNVKYVFDFEKTSIEPRTQELFRSATLSFLNTDFNQISIEKIKLYTKSYQEVYPVKDQELRNGLLAHYLKSIHGFWVENEHYIKGNNRADLFLELNYKRLKFMSERLNDLI